MDGLDDTGTMASFKGLADVDELEQRELEGTMNEVWVSDKSLLYPLRHHPQGCGLPLDWVMRNLSRGMCPR